MPTMNDRIQGCIIGGGIGDYLGCPYEGRPGPIEATIPESSSITDDTQLTLATCQGIVRAGAVDPEAIATSFTEWFVQGRVHGIGSSTLKALRDLSFGAHWALAGATGEMAAGNGAAMRIAPLGFCVDPISSEGRQRIKEVAHLTHRNDEAYAGALAICIAIRTVGFDFIGTCIDELPDSNTRDRLICLADEKTSSVLDMGTRYGASGYVADSVPLALVDLDVDESSTAFSDINESHLDSVDISNPGILAEIAPGQYNLIDGNHRAEKARRLGVATIPAYKLRMRQHLPFLTSKKAYLIYVEYWNGKLR